MTDDLTPKWAVELLVRFEQLDAKITAAEERNGAHAEWSSRNIKDLEMRLRKFEAANLFHAEERITAVERKVYGFSGAIAIIVAFVEVIRWNK